jgi:hypothetical protein
MLTEAELLPLMRQACFDPGMFCKRGDNYQEPLWEWQSRAVLKAIEPHLESARGRYVDAHVDRILAQNPGIDQVDVRERVKATIA